MSGAAAGLIWEVAKSMTPCMSAGDIAIHFFRTIRPKLPDIPKSAVFLLLVLSLRWLSPIPLVSNYQFPIRRDGDNGSGPAKLSYPLDPLISRTPTHLILMVVRVATLLMISVLGQLTAT